MLIIVTIASIALAAIMSVVAWRATREERRRSDARVEALARDIHASTAVDEFPLRPAATPFPVETPQANGLFAAASETSSSGTRWGLALAVGAFVLAALAAVVVVMGGDAPGTRVAMASASAPPPAVKRAAVPLELVALSHDRDENQLTVRGVVRNPASGIEMDRLTAVVVLLNRDGNVVTTGRAAVAAPALIPGGESPFAVTVPESGEVARYRVSFRSDERPVPHVDKRAQPGPAGEAGQQ
jgi:hypothetical protein